MFFDFNSPHIRYMNHCQWFIKLMYHSLQDPSKCLSLSPLSFFLSFSLSPQSLLEEFSQALLGMEDAVY